MGTDPHPYILEAPCQTFWRRQPEKFIDLHTTHMSRHEDSESSSDDEDQWLTDDDEDSDMPVTGHPHYHTPVFLSTNPYYHHVY